ncbi:type III PLP-dependent enzyme [Actinomycetospora sp. NBRC 106375]|uniref:type III PLP-dependent enzyme n=1 Tax=Actinomycetospora sp. NBRC 106375 TaxID=3032207 RepID=UPI0025541EF7|nr:type III PLP-dependent enzyme [Actinomycetospora sp. NBRC 106375]
MGVEPGLRAVAHPSTGDRATPHLDLDLARVRDAYRAMRTALPGVELCYAVKANPHPAVLALLAAEGASFDLASVGELDLCLLAGAAPGALSWGNPVKKAADVRAARSAGVSRFTTDAPADVDLLAREAPGARIGVRLAVGDDGAATPFAGKFGAGEDEAAALLHRARTGGLTAAGIGFHVGSQQRDPAAWARAIDAAARVATRLGEHAPTELNLGGGFPTTHADGPAPDLEACGAAIRTALARHAPRWRPRLVAEPGRALVADAGVLRAEVVLVAERGGRRWVYLDVGRYQGLAETEAEMIVYRLRTPGNPGATGPVVLAGPTCDGDDVLYRHADVRLPLDLAPGDVVEFLGAGAYTSSYASVGFNGLPPLPTYVHDTPEEGGS